MTPLVNKIEVMDDYKILLFFENGEKKIYDMKKNFKYPVFEKLKDIELFKKVKISGDTIQWETGEDISPEDLYFNSISVN